MNDDKIRILVGSESSDSEYEAVQNAFAGHDVNVTKDYVRKSVDLPMVIMILAQNVAGSAIWDLVKLSYGKALGDKRLKNRPPQIVVKRSTYDAVITKTGFHVRSVDENLTFNSIEELIKYDQSKNKP